MNSSAKEIGRLRKWLLLGALALLALPAAGLRTLFGEGIAGTSSADQGVILYIVNTTNDTVVVGACENSTAGCSLRGAIQAANSHPGADGISINLPAGSTINLSAALPDITESIIISPAAAQPSGSGRVTVTRPGSSIFRIFNVVTSGPVTLSGLNISRGNALPPGGGAISNSSSGTVDITNCTLSGNTASGGGDGGGIFNSANGTLNITDCSISSNRTVTPGVGGGIYNSPGGTVNVTRCVFYFNNGGGSGGGIYNAGTLDVTNSTFYQNSATDFGGGIYNTGNGTVNISNSTFARNGSGLTLGGGVFSTSIATVRSSIIALNNISDVSGPFISAGFNLIRNNNGASGSFPGGNPNVNNDIVGTPQLTIDPKLDPNGLRDNGGLTITVALQLDSPAIDKGTSNGLTGKLTTDQRGTGYTRIFDFPIVPNAAGGDGTDVGAFELAAPFGVSRKMHGVVMFDVGLPLAGTAGIECRTGGVNGDHQVVVTFPSSLIFVVAAGVTTGTGSVSSFSVSDTQVIVNLTGVADAQTIVLTLFGVNNGMTTTNYSVSMGVLLCDTNADRFVNAGDSLQTRNYSGQATDATNFRSDVNADGFVNSGDATVVRSRSGTSLP